jgi:Ala-tRNA(Pro) deacylase
MPIKRLRQFLDEKRVRYVTLVHSPAYTAQEVAQAAHVPGRRLAKAVMVKLDGRMAMAVCPASHRLVLARLARGAGAHHAELASEAEFGRLFPGCELGATPPFGNLWDLPVYVARALHEELTSEHEVIAFAAGTHTEVVALAYADYLSIVEPEILDFSEPA